MQDITNPDDTEITQLEEQDDVARIQSLVQELGLVGGVARIYRQGPGQTKSHYWGEVPVDSFSMENIRLQYGGGDYMIRFAAKGGRYVRSIKFSIDPSIVGEIERKQQASQTAQNPVTTQPNDTLLAYMMQQQQQTQQQSAAMMTLMVTMMSKSQESMAAVIGAALSGKQPQVVSTDGRMFDLLTPLLVEGLKPRGGVTEMVEAVKAVRQLTGETAPPQEPKEEDMLGKFANIAQVAAPLLSAFMQRPQTTPPPQPPQPPQGFPRVPESLPPATTPSPMMPNPANPEQAATLRKAEELLGQLRTFTPFLVKAAAKNADVETYVEMLDANVDDESYDILCTLLEQPDWVQTLFGNNPDVVANIGWFNSLREVILHGEGEAPATQVHAPAGPVPGPRGPSVDPEQRP